MANDNEMMHQGKTIAQWEKDFNGQFSYGQLEKIARCGGDLQKILMFGLDESEDASAAANEQATNPKVEFVIYDSDGTELSRNEVKPSDITSVSLECMSNCMDDMNDAAKAMPNSSCKTAMIYVDDMPLSTISSVRKAQLRKLFDSLNEKEAVDEVDAADEEAALAESKSKGKDGIYDVKGWLAFISKNSKPTDKLMVRVDKKPYDIFQVNSKGGVTTIDLTPTVMNEAEDK